ncbi:MAG: response regulator [Lachnospiraceae bacterium]|nr:response regulator [Lachnospiraceae bacterium]
MYTKSIYAAIYFLTIITILFMIKRIQQVREEYGKILMNAMLCAVIAIIGNILIALSYDEMSAGIAYSIYFASIDWIIYYTLGFCLSYTEYHAVKSRLKFPVALLMGIDSTLILLNPVTGISFYIYENKSIPGEIFFQTGFYPAYYAHLMLDYLSLLIALIFIIYKIIKSYSLYRYKYMIILSVLLLVVVLNYIYMSLSLVLDASVIFYAVAFALVCFSIRTFVPRRLLVTSVERAVDDFGEGLIIFDINDRCIYANAFSRINFGLDMPTCTPDCEPMATVIRKMHDKNDPGDSVMYSRTYDKNGKKTTRYFEVRYNTLNDKKGRVIGSYYLTRETTEEVSSLNGIKEAKENADNANRAKSMFLAGMSHEIRTPLSSILGMNELILRDTKDPLVKDYAANIREAGDELLNLINDVLDFSSIETGKTEVIAREYEPSRLLKDCFNLFEGAAGEKGLYLHATCDEGIPSRLIGDPELIGQILSNIVSNAVKYTKEGGITVDMTYDMTVSGRIDLIIDVTDTGIGIPKDDIPYLFDSFRRINANDDTYIRGTGLGLSITRRLLHLMNGEVHVKSTPGKGSSFVAVIPQMIADRTPAGTPLDLHLSGNAVHKESFTAKDARILIVDDVKVNLMVVEGLLTPTMMKTDTAMSGDEAVKKCMETKYDVILLDHRMPVKNGIETFHEIRQKGLNRETPVIMLTANVANGMEEEYLKIGFCDYLAKPVRAVELEAAILRRLPSGKVTML